MVVPWVGVIRHMTLRWQSPMSPPFAVWLRLNIHRGKICDVAELVSGLVPGSYTLLKVTRQTPW